MDELFDETTIEGLRKKSPREAYDAVKEAVYRLGPVSSAEFADAFEELVRRGVLTRQELEEFWR